MTKTQKYSRRRLASLITRSIFITISVLTVIVLLQNYQVNQQVVAQEAARSKLQTSSLVQQIFNYRLQSLEIQQDSYSRNLSLTSALMSLNASDIDAFFLMALIKSARPSLPISVSLLTMKNCCGKTPMPNFMVLNHRHYLKSVITCRWEPIGMWRRFHP
ncbi:LuxQ periplasmic sensor domain-containing protein [Vibrio olivae]